MKKLIGILFGILLFAGVVSAKEPKYYKEITLIPERTIVLYDTIEPRMIQNAINKMIELEGIDQRLPIYVVIDSPGGYVDAGWKFINTLKAIKAPTIGIVSSKAYSMAAIISLFFNKLYMVDSSDMMFHEAAFMIAGSETIVSSRFFATMNYLNKLHKRIAKKLNMSFSTYRTKIHREWWLLPEEAMKVEICDGILLSLKYKFEIPTRFRVFELNLAPFDIYMGLQPPEDYVKIGF